MTLDIQYVLNIILGAVTVVAGWLLARVQEHEKRVQRIEDVYTIKFEDLKAEFKDMEAKIDRLTQSMSDLTMNIHKSKNQENALNTTLSAILNHLEFEQNKQ